MTNNRFLNELMRYALILLALAITLIPIIWMATMAFKPVAEWTTATNDLHWLPRNPTWGNFEYIFTGRTDDLIVTLDRVAIKPIMASLITSLLGTAIAVIVGTLGAYGVSRYKVGMNLPLSVLQLRLFPPLAVMIPVMIMWTYLGMVDTWWGLSLIYGIVTLPFAFWLMMTFFEEVPRENRGSGVGRGLQSVAGVLSRHSAGGEGATRHHLPIRLHPQLERLRDRVAAHPQGLGDYSGLYERPCRRR